MSEIDERIVRMTFDNRQFEEGVSTTVSSLHRLQDGMKLEGAAKNLDEVSAATDRTRDSLGRFSKGLDEGSQGLDDISESADKVTLNHLRDAVDNIAGRFKAMSVVATTALVTVAQQAIATGERLLKSLTTEPIMAGFHEYETNMNSIQTIMANTGLEGQKGLNKVNDALNELNHYSDQTIYNFTEMARNIGTFTAAGVNLKVSTAAIKGIANLAAVSGSNSEQASAAMYQLSQALAAGKVSLEDWNSVVNAGMGGKVFQNALMETARVHGVAIDKMVKDEGSFRLTLQNGWLTSDILTETLSKFTGDLNEKQLKSMGYNEKQIAGILKMGKTAQDAATKVKTMSQLINTLQEAAGSGWTKTWQLIFGDFNEAKTLFTDVSNVLGGFINASSDARNKVIGDWKKLGGRTVLIEGISNAFHALIDIIKPIRDAFREIFPRTTGKQLYDLTKSFRDFTAKLKVGKDTAENIKRTFAGFFAILGIGWDILKEVAKTLFHLFGVVTDGSGGFLKVTANIGDFFVKLRENIKQGNALTKFFQKLGEVLAIPIKLIKNLAGHIGDLFGKFDGTEAADSVTGWASKLEPIGKLFDALIDGGGKLDDILDDIWDTFEPMAKKMGELFKNLGKWITDSLQGVDYEDVLHGIDTGLFAGFLLLIKKLVDKFTGGDDDSGGGGLFSGIFDPIKESFEELTNTLSAMQTTLKATTLLEIAAAVGVLTLSVVALSKIDTKHLKTALAGMAVMFGQLLGAMAVFEKVSGSSSFLKLIGISTSLILLATAVDLLTIAVKQLSELDWKELAKGLTAVTVIMGVLAGTAQLMPDGKKLISTGLGLLILSGAILILSDAVKDLSELDWKELAKGLTGVAALLVSLALFTKFAEAGKAGVLQGAGIVLLAVGIGLLADAVKKFASFSWKELGKGLAGIAGGLLLIGGALKLVPPSSIFSAAGILIVALSLGKIVDAVKDMSKLNWKQLGKGLTGLAGALVLISAALYLLPPSSLISAAAIFVVASSLGMITDALEDMSKMSWKEIGKSLVELAGALGIIALAMMAMESALPGAAALVVVAASLAILQPVLQAFGDMSWTEIAKSMVELAAVFVVLGTAGLVLSPLVPVLIGLGAAIALLGVGMLAAGAGLLLFATGLTALAAAGAAGAAAIVGIVAGLIGLIPLVMKQIGLGIVAFAEVIANAGPAIVKAITTVLEALIAAIVKLTPKIVDALLKLLLMLLQKLAEYVPKMVDAGFDLLVGILDGIGDNIGRVIDSAVNIVVEFIKALGKQAKKLADAGAKFIIDLIDGISDSIDDNSRELGKAGGRLATSIIEGMVKGIAGGASSVAKAAEDVAKGALSSAASFLHINSPSKKFIEIGASTDEGFALGIDRFGHLVTTATKRVGKGAIDTMKKSLSNVSDIVSGDLDMAPTITPVLDLSDIRKNADQIGGIISANPISVSGTYSSARGASEVISNGQGQNSPVGENGETPSIQFNQYNTSPKALSEAEVYRQTKNQLSVAKEALAIP